MQASKATAANRFACDVDGCAASYLYWRGLTSHKRRKHDECARGGGGSGRTPRAPRAAPEAASRAVSDAGSDADSDADPDADSDADFERLHAGWVENEDGMQLALALSSAITEAGLPVPREEQGQRRREQHGGDESSLEAMRSKQHTPNPNAELRTRSKRRVQERCQCVARDRRHKDDEAEQTSKRQESARRGLGDQA